MRPCCSSAWRERSWPREHPSLLRTGLAASVPLHHGRAEPVTLREHRPRPGSRSCPAPLLPCPPSPIWSPPRPSPSPPSGRRPGCPCTGGAFPSGQPGPPGSESDREGGPCLPGTPSPRPEGVWGCVPCPAKVQGGPRHRNGVSPSEGHRGFSALLPAWGMTATAHGLVPRDAARPSQAAVWLPSRPRLWSHQPWDSDGQVYHTLPAQHPGNRGSGSVRPPESPLQTRPWAGSHQGGTCSVQPAPAHTPACPAPSAAAPLASQVPPF